MTEWGNSTQPREKNQDLTSKIGTAFVALAFKKKWNLQKTCHVIIHINVYDDYEILVQSHSPTLKSVGRDHLQQIEGCPMSQ